MRHRDGSWRWLEAVGHNLLDDPSVSGIVVTCRDVSEQIAADEQLQQASVLLASALDLDVTLQNVAQPANLLRVYLAVFVLAARTRYRSWRSVASGISDAVRDGDRVPRPWLSPRRTTEQSIIGSTECLGPVPARARSGWRRASRTASYDRAMVTSLANPAPMPWDRLAPRAGSG